MTSGVEVDESQLGAPERISRAAAPAAPAASRVRASDTQWS